MFENILDEAELRRILKVITKHILWAYSGVIKDFAVTTSIGISKYPDDGTAYDELFKKADKSLYIAKAKGKNRYIIYDESKHGKLDASEESDRPLGISAVLSNEKKISMISELVLKLHSDGLAVLDEALAKLQEYFDVDGIAIYKGSSWKRVYSVGKYIGAIDNFPMYDGDYKSNFDESGVYSENNTRHINTHYPMVYSALEKQETTAFVQVWLDDGNYGGVMISFDVFNRSSKRSESDRNYMTIAGRLICELVMNSDKL